MHLTCAGLGGVRAPISELSGVVKHTRISPGGDGLHPPEAGVRVSFAGGKASAKDGPFTEAKELVGGFWMIDVKSKDEAVQWALRCPALDGDVIEVRQVQEFEDFPPEIQAVIPEEQR